MTTLAIGHNQTRRGHSTIERILAAAAEILGREGLAATKISRISEVSGVSVGSVYHHFGSKDGILTRLIQDFCQRARDDIDALDLASRDPDEALRLAIALTVKQFRENPELYRTTAEEINAQPKIWEPMRNLRVHYERSLLPALQSDLIAQGKANPEEAISRMMQVVLSVLTHIVIFDSGPYDMSEEQANTTILDLARRVLA